MIGAEGVNTVEAVNVVEDVATVVVKLKDGVVIAGMNAGSKFFYRGVVSGRLGFLNVIYFGKLDIGGTVVEVEFRKAYSLRTQPHLCYSLANL